MKKLAQINQKGFTLIELLIVIVIIGILAGIVITILNPVRQQNRARDGVIVATMNKIVADIRAQAAADISGVGNLPTCANLVSSLQNVGSSSCGASNGTFAISGVTNAAGANTTFTYVRSAVAGSANFCLSAPANDTSTAGFILFGCNAATCTTAQNFTTPQRFATGCDTTWALP